MNWAKLKSKLALGVLDRMGVFRFLAKVAVEEQAA
jgi:hypothetical protein